jgi:hypothetical protein
MYSRLSDLSNFLFSTFWTQQNCAAGRRNSGRTTATGVKASPRAPKKGEFSHITQPIPEYVPTYRRSKRKEVEGTDEERYGVVLEKDVPMKATRAEDWISGNTKAESYSTHERTGSFSTSLFEECVSNVSNASTASDIEAATSPPLKEGSRKASQKWTAAEDALLQQVIKAQPAQLQWKEIARNFPNRTNVQCYQRWHRSLKPGLVKGPWTAKEDQLLIQATLQQRLAHGVVQTTEGDDDWPKIAQCLPGRSTKQCRERWTHVLDPSVKKAKWSPEEDATLRKAHAEMGNKWAAIAKVIPGRTQLHVRDRWRVLKKIDKQNEQRGAQLMPNMSALALGTGGLEMQMNQHSAQMAALANRQAALGLVEHGLQHAEDEGVDFAIGPSEPALMQSRAMALPKTQAMAGASMDPLHQSTMEMRAGEQGLRKITYEQFKTGPMLLQGASEAGDLHIADVQQEAMDDFAIPGSPYMGEGGEEGEGGDGQDSEWFVRMFSFEDGQTI